MANGRKPVLTGVIQSADGSKKVIGRIALWAYEGKKDEGGKEDSSSIFK